MNFHNRHNFVVTVDGRFLTLKRNGSIWFPIVVPHNPGDDHPTLVSIKESSVSEKTEKSTESGGRVVFPHPQGSPDT